MNRYVWLLLLCLGLNVPFNLCAQDKPGPKLVVGLVIDQMRWDYLYRYADRYESGGFKRLLREGFSCENTFIPYTPTYTGAGHACVYTGSVPSLNGIMGNNWYSKAERRVVYCTEDASVQTVGSSSTAGQMSPRYLWSTTISDELRLAQNFKNKTIAIAFKDRGAILPGGHSANAAYWFDAATGGFISSTYYMSALPAWLTAFNAKKLPDAYVKKGWNTLFPIASYTQSTTDSQEYENIIPNEDNTFPHRTDNISGNKYETFRYLPAANTFTFDMAKAAIEGEALGKRGVTDMLAISCSTPDHLGHSTGPNSIEAEDMYLRLDKDIALFLTYLDGTVGKGQYVFFVSADHGVAHVPRFLQQHKIPAGTLDDAEIRNRLNAGLLKNYNVTGAITSLINYQVYLNDSVLALKGLNKAVIKKNLIDSLMVIPGITKAIDLENIQTAGLPDAVEKMVVNGYNQKLSGDIQFMYLPQWFDGGSKGTTHGSWNPYDSHIPLLWFGWNIKPGRSYQTRYMSDITPTLAALLHIQMPNASVGNVIDEMLK